MREKPKPSERLIVALDFSDPARAETMVERLGSTVAFYKIGMELAYSGDASNNGFTLADRLIAQGKKVFMDLKLHDIPNTVARATAALARRGYEFLTIHAYPPTMAAAKEGVEGSALKLLAVTVMTSYDDADLAAAGYGFSVQDLVARRAAQAWGAKIDGLILSAAEVPALRLMVGDEMILVTPGIRPQGAEADDQKRVATPASAIAAGADYLVVGRPIIAAEDPAAAAEAIVREIEGTSG
ncbi:orotidine-5'-phosphate decarboxylase [Methylovirgula sp. HY1]|uniref:orotidine-5'-phosphate decarboxylase n=1 Tax=Methylovirgula sp. HY1 TaxID=2822761 RepID=UPI001C5ADF32|nr:orotidine-5'-phosphate decarboxylase [Methylovirgula sp. HY1]QXX75446.1 Orotidine 5'-phosphate decarboxylase [Methylovirgula sp. HY1]